MSLEHSPGREAKNRGIGNVGRMLVSDQEAANMLGCSRTTVWRRVADGSLPKPIKIGGLSRFILDEISARVEAAKAARGETKAA